MSKHLAIKTAPKSQQSSARIPIPLIVAIALITLVALILRVICCFHAWPYHIHADEHTVVENAIDMLSRNSWEAYVYNRPDQLEIKLDSILFSLFSYARYGIAASEAFAAHESAFYLTARLLTVAFGTALIPLCAILSYRITSRFAQTLSTCSSICSSVFVGLSPTLIEHSAYATPDIVLAFLSAAFAYALLRYFESGRNRYVVLCSVLIGLCVSVKYPGAVFSFAFLIVVLWRDLALSKHPGRVFRIGAVSVALVLFTFFVIAPNLFTNIGEVIETLKTEARPSHLGADGLGFFGNLLFYVSRCVADYGLVSSVLVILGLTHVLLHDRSAVVPLLPGFIFLLCISALSLHWTRWGTPVYVAYAIIASVGLAAITKFALENAHRANHAALRVCIVAIMSLLAINVLTGGLCITRYMALPDSSTVAVAFCEENEIDLSNSVTCSYSPLSLNGVITATPDTYFEFDAGRAKLKEEYSYAKYLVMGTSHKDRFYAEPERYKNEVMQYDSIDATYRAAYKLESKDNWSSSPFELANIINNLGYLHSAEGPTGSNMIVYILAES